MIRNICLVLLLFGLQPAYAVVVRDLYTFRAEVDNNYPQTRMDLLPTGLDEVLLKVAGNRAILQHPAIIDAKLQLDKYVKDFAYKETDSNYKLAVNFNQQMVDKLIAATGRGNLSKNRPLIMAWVAINSDNLVELVGDQAHPELAELIDTTAQQHGIPMVLPLLDLTERLFIGPMDVATYNEVPLQQAAGRYNADLVLVGNIKQGDGQWQCAWRLYTNDQIVDWNTSGEDLELEIDGMLGELSDQLLNHYANINRPRASNDNTVFVRITGVADVAEYAKIMDYLMNLTAIKNVEVSNINEQDAVFAVTADGGRRAIRSAISLDRVLAEVSTEADHLEYRLN